MKQIRNKFISAVRLHLIRAGVVTVEGTESFYLNLSNPVNATISDSQGIGTITQYSAPVGNGYTDMILQVARARAGISITATGTPITLSVTPNRGASPSGVAPLSVLFDTTATTAATSLPFHELFYVHNFGDDDQEVWQYGTQNNLVSKNIASGPIATHVWEKPGTYSVKTTAFHISSGGTFSASNTVTTTVTVTDPNTVYSGTNTVYIANGILPSAADPDVPAGATYINATTWADVCAQLTIPNRRVLLKRGHVWDSTGTAQYSSVAGITLGCYGEGALPKIRHTGGVGDYWGALVFNSGATDWRVSDIEFDGQQTSADTSHIIFLSSGGGGGQFHTYLRNYWHNCGSVAVMANDVTLVDNRLYDLMGKGGNVGLYPALDSRFSILGNSIANCQNIEMNIRVQGGKKFVISNNYLADPGSGGDKHALAIRGWSYPFNGTDYTEDFVVADNYLTGYSYALLQVESQNSSYDERIQNGIIERNTIAPTSTAYAMIASAQHNLTIRNNIFDMTAATGNGIVISPSPFMAPDSTYIYNNTFYSPTATTFSAIYISHDATSGDPSGTVAKNNVAYAPNSTKTGANNGAAGSFFYNISASSYTFTNNSTDPQVKSTSPGFTVPAVEMMDWKTSGYTTSGGTYVPSFDDAFGNIKASSAYMGAVSTPTQTPIVVPIVNVSRTSGKGPLAIYFDASETFTNLRNVNPTHEYFFAWDFGDDVGATWVYGKDTTQNKNTAYGHQVAHVYETSGTKTWTLSVLDSSGGLSTVTGTITVSAWTEAETVYISNGSVPVAGVNGVGIGAAGYYNETTWAGVISRKAANRRIRLDNSSTWAVTTSLTCDDGLQIEGYGAGTEWNVTTGTWNYGAVFDVKNRSDVRIIGGKHTGTGFGPGTIEANTVGGGAGATTGAVNILMMNMKSTATYGLYSSSTGALPDGIFAVNCYAYDIGLNGGGTGAIPLYIEEANRLVILGSKFDNVATSHCARVAGGNRVVVANNQFSRSTLSQTHCFTLRGFTNNASTTVWNGLYTEKAVIRDNYIMSETASGYLMHIAPQNDHYAEKHRNIIVENNFFKSSLASTLWTQVIGTCTIRNNLFEIDRGTFAIQVASASDIGNGSPTDTRVYNNTAWKKTLNLGTDGFSAIVVSTEASGSPAPTAITGLDIRNNLAYAPNDTRNWNQSNGTAGAEMISISGLTPSYRAASSNNSSDVQVRTVRPWTATTPVAYADYAPAVGSYAINGGSTDITGVKDFLNVYRSGTMDIGALVA